MNLLEAPSAPPLHERTITHAHQGDLRQTVERFWQDTPIGKYVLRYDITAMDGHVLDARAEELAQPLWTEQLAASGMRRVFDAVGIRSAQATTPVSEANEALVKHTVTLAFPSSQDLCANINAVARPTKRDYSHRLRATPYKAGKFSGTTQVTSWFDDQLLIAADEEAPVRAWEEPVLDSFYAHDMRLHIAAWLSTPPVIISAISRKAVALYHTAQEDPEKAKEAISVFTGQLDGTITTRNLARLATGTVSPDNKGFGRYVVDLLGYGSAEYFEEITREHIADPRYENLLRR